MNYNQYIKELYKSMETFYNESMTIAMSNPQNPLLHKSILENLQIILKSTNNISNTLSKMSIENDIQFLQFLLDNNLYVTYSQWKDGSYAADLHHKTTKSPGLSKPYSECIQFGGFYGKHHSKELAKKDLMNNISLSTIYVPNQSRTEKEKENSENRYTKIPVPKFKMILS